LALIKEDHTMPLLLAGVYDRYYYDCLPTAFSEIAKQNKNGKTTYANGCALTPSASDGSGKYSTLV